MEYSRKEYLSDLRDPSVPHVKDRERFAAFYEELGKDEESYNTLQYAADRLFFLKPHGSILELGCHFGYNMIHWAREGFRCVGVDISQNLIDFGKQQLARESAETQSLVTFVQGWIEDFVPDEKFDTVVITETLEHVIDPLLILQKARECVSESGLIYIAVPETKWGNNSHVRGIDRKQMEALLEQAKLAPVEWYVLTNPEEVVVIAKKI